MDKVDRERLRMRGAGLTVLYAVVAVAMAATAAWVFVTGSTGGAGYGWPVALVAVAGWLGWVALWGNMVVVTDHGVDIHYLIRHRDLDWENLEEVRRSDDNAIEAVTSSGEVVRAPRPFNSDQGRWLTVGVLARVESHRLHTSVR